jgi:hypothetical protein
MTIDRTRRAHAGTFRAAHSGNRDMVDAHDTRASIIRAFDDEAELLAVYQLDLLAQIEAQLRAAHYAMRRIESLRRAHHRGGPELSNGQRQTALIGLSDEVARLDEQLSDGHDCCGVIQGAIKRMQSRLADLKHAAARLRNVSESDARPKTRRLVPSH